MNDPIALFFGASVTSLNGLSVCLRILFAILVGAIVGCERSSKRHSAGLRTFILITLTSTIAMMLDLYLGDIHGSGFYLLAASTVIGSAIISVNSMLTSSRNQIKGLTTSAGLWGCGVIGLAIGAGFYTAALCAFVALLCSLSLFPAFEVYLKNRSNHFEIHLELKNSAFLQDFVATIRKLGLVIDDIETNPAYLGSGLSVYTIAITISSKELKQYKTHREIIEALSSLDYIYHIEEMHR